MSIVEGINKNTIFYAERTASLIKNCAKIPFGVGKHMSHIPQKLRRMIEMNQSKQWAPPSKPKPAPSYPNFVKKPQWAKTELFAAPRALHVPRQQPNYSGIKKRGRLVARSNRSARSTVAAQRPQCEVVQLDKRGYVEMPNSVFLEKLIHGIHEDGTVRDGYEGMVRAHSSFTGEPFHLYSFQREAVELFQSRLRDSRWIVNGAAMGLGKTIMSILLWCTYCVHASSKKVYARPLRPIDRTGGWKMLVVAPKAVLSSWYKTLLERTHLESSNIILEEKRDKLEQAMREQVDNLESEVAVVLVTYDLVRIAYTDTHEEVDDPNDGRRKVWRRKEMQPLPSLFQWVKQHGDHLVVSFDESHHRLRNHDSKTNVAHTAMMRLAPSSKGILTSGTACCNRPSDLMAQIRAIGDSQYSDIEDWYPDKRDHKIVSTAAINYFRERMVSIPESVLTLPKMHQILIEPVVKNDPVIQWDVYQGYVDSAREASTFSASDSEQDRRAKSVELISLLRKLDLMLIHPDLLRYDAKTLRHKDNCHLFDKMAQRPTAYLNAVVDVVSNAFQRDERSMIITSESVTTLLLVQRVIERAMQGQGLTTKGYLYEGKLDMASRLKLEHDFCDAANAPVEANPTTMHIMYLSMHAGANGITILGPKTMLKIPPGGFNPATGRQVDKRFHRIGVKHEVHVVTLRVRGSAAHAIANVNEDKRYLSELTTSLNTLGDDDGESFGCSRLDDKLAENIPWKVKGTYAQNLWSYNPLTRQLDPPTSYTSA